MSIEVIKPGLQCTIVAHERNGFRYLGVCPGGAMDTFAMNMANFLVGNDGGVPTLEINFPAPEFRFATEMLIGLCGQGFRFYVNNKIFSSWRPILVKEKSIMRFEKSEPGSRAYLAVYSGWKAQKWLGSFSTHNGAIAGGYSGRALMAGDVLEANRQQPKHTAGKELNWGISKNELANIYLPPHEIRIVSSAETDFLSLPSKEKLLSNSFAITGQSNRMGFRLAGERLTLKNPLELVSSPVDFGTIQLLPDGNLIILMADHQTTGGYPRIGSVIKSDLPRLAQAGVNDRINFQMISRNEGEIEILKRNKLLAKLQRACLTQYHNHFSL